MKVPVNRIPIFEDAPFLVYRFEALIEMSTIAIPVGEPGDEGVERVEIRPDL